QFTAFKLTQSSNKFIPSCRNFLRKNFPIIPCQGFPFLSSSCPGDSPITIIPFLNFPYGFIRGVKTYLYKPQETQESVPFSDLYGVFSICCLSKNPLISENLFTQPPSVCDYFGISSNLLDNSRE